MTVKDLPKLEYVPTILPWTGATAVFGFAREGVTERPNVLIELGVAQAAAAKTNLAPAPNEGIDRLVDWALSQDHDPGRAERIEREAWGDTRGE